MLPNFKYRNEVLHVHFLKLHELLAFAFVIKQQQTGIYRNAQQIPRPTGKTQKGHFDM